MSDSTMNWELGVVSFYDSFNDFDRYAKVGAAFLGKEDGTWAEQLTLDSGLSSNYTLTPYYLNQQLAQDQSTAENTPTIPGSEIIIGPSTDTTYSGSIDRASVKVLTSGVAPTLWTAGSQSFIARPTGSYEVGDQVIIRTMPLGWSQTTRTSGAVYWGLSPIGRYDTRQSLVKAASVSIPGIASYERECERGVRMYTNQSTSVDTQYIKAVSNLHTFDPRVRCYRSSWFYRIGQMWSPGQSVGSIGAKIRIGLMGVDGNWIREDDLYAIGHTKAEYGNFDTAGNLRSEQLFGEGNATAGWTYAEGYVSGFSTDSSTLDTAGITATKWNHWDYNDKAGDPSRTASTRASRWGVELGLERGVNTAFDVDDFVIEHAHGTSQEANGFYAISDFPDPETIVVQPITLWKGSRMANGSLKLITTETEQRPKFTLSAEFQDVPVTTYEDLRVLETWVKRGCLIAIRTKIDGIPEVMVGVIRVKRIPSSTWALSYCTFTLEFEEA